MAVVADLSGVALFEYDKNGDTLWAWKYPSIDEKLQTCIDRKCNLQEQNGNDKHEFFGKCGQDWFYVTFVAVEGNQKLPKVLKVGAILVAKDFNPERYYALGNIMLKTYLQTGTPVSVLEFYLAVFTKGKCSTEDGLTFEAANYQPLGAMLNSSLKETISLFGIETIIIYTALLQKRKIVVLASKLDSLLSVCRSLPNLIWHRKDWSIVYPYVDLHEDELNDIRSKKSYILGCMDQAIEGKTEMYDILLNVSEGEITINPKSKAYFQMGKLHKDIAMYLVKSAEDENVTEEEIIEGLHKRTIDIITNLKSLGATEEDDGKSFVTLKTLQSRNLSSAMQTFLYNLALAEGLIRRHKSD